MNLSKREKLLGGAVALILLLFVGNYLWESIKKGFVDKQDKIASLQQNRDNLNLQVTAGSVAKAKLNRLVAQSLPSNEQEASAQYMQWLIDLAEESGLADAQFRSLGDSVEPNLFHSYRFQVSGTGTIEDATKLLHAFHAKDYLHRVLRFDLRPLANNNPPNRLTISMDCEALALDSAKRDQPRPGNNSPRIERSVEDYRANIAGRNIFAPTNHVPLLDPKRTVAATLGLKMDVGIDAKENDPGQSISYAFEGDVPKGMQIDPSTGKLTWTSSELGDYEVSVRATDSGIPARSSVQMVSIKVSDPPPATKKPIEFNVASQAFVSALVSDGKGPQAWVRSKTEGKTLYLRKGDSLKLGDVQGKVVDVGANFMEVETDGKRWTVGLDESLADAFQRSANDESNDESKDDAKDE
jgi:hypothetical protein